MVEPKELSFGTDWCDIEIGGVPLVEAVLRAFVGRCQECGCDAEHQKYGSVLTNLVSVEGTLYGDTFCAGCIDADDVDGPTFHLPPLPTDEGSD